MGLHVVLYQPEIPQNTGNIARTCVVTGAALHIIEPAGFSLEDKMVKRAGLDYWDLLDLHRYKNFDIF
jgi:tRNA (cytidine/uridine-2'-O-)-methyltransferase